MPATSEATAPSGTDPAAQQPRRAPRGTRTPPPADRTRTAAPSCRRRAVPPCAAGGGPRGSPSGACCAAPAVGTAKCRPRAPCAGARARARTFPAPGPPTRARIRTASGRPAAVGACARGARPGRALRGRRLVAACERTYACPPALASGGHLGSRARRGRSPQAPACATLRRVPRDDLAELLARRAATRDEARPEAVDRRHATGARTARENVADLVDPGSFVEYGRFAIAAQRGRRELRRADRAHAGRRPDRRHRAHQRRAVRRSQRLRGALVRLHGARRHAGHARPPQEGPAVRADRAHAAADRLLRGGRRRAAGRHGLSGRVRARHARVRAVGTTVGPRAADRRGRRPLLRRQRRDRRLLGPDRRDRERLARHGRPGDDRGRRAREGRAGRHRAARDAGGQRGDRRRGRGRGRGDGGHEAAARLLPGRDAARRGARSGPHARPRARARAARLRRPAGDRDARRRRLGHVPARALRARDGDRARPDRGPPGRRDRQRHAAPGRRDHQRRRRQGRALHAAVRRLRPPARLARRHAGDDGRARGRGDRRWCGTARACS